MIVFAISAVLLQAQAPAAPSVPSDSQFCAQMVVTIAQIEARAPIQLDELSQLDGATLDCRQRTIAFNKSVLRNLAEMRPDWQTVAQEAWDNMMCNNPIYRPLADRGWQFAQYFTFRSGERVTMRAECASNKKGGPEGPPFLISHSRPL